MNYEILNFKHYKMKFLRNFHTSRSQTADMLLLLKKLRCTVTGGLQ
jgi:hypothetical protein